MTDDVTRILRELDAGNDAAARELLPLVYAKLRELAERRMAVERPGATLQATALVHEAWMRLVGDDEHRSAAGWRGAGHFYGAAAEAMRRILIERSRARASLKRGGGLLREPLDPDAFATEPERDDLLDLDEALREFAAIDPRKARLVELRFFAGLTLEEAARALGLSPATADRDWAFARAWLFAKLNPSAPGKSALP